MVGKKSADCGFGASAIMNPERLAHMANQIAANLAAQCEDVASAATAQHILDYWDPRMKAAFITVDPNMLDPIARAAIARISAVITEAN